MNKIVIVNGYPGCGKSTFNSFCMNNLNGIAYDISTVDLPKQLYKICGWDGNKTPEDRKFLSELKDFLNTHNDIIWKWCMNKVNELPDDSIIFMDCREPDMIERFAKEANAITIFIRRSSVSKKKQSNSSDADVEKYCYDFYFDNNGTLDELQYLAGEFSNFIKQWGNETWHKTKQ